MTPWKTGDPNPTITITMEDGGVIKAVLFPDKAPNTVNNFISLVNSGFYEGKIFHRVIPNFMIQGGCPDGNGRGNPGYSIKGEFANNGVQNRLSHTRGTMSMARGPDYDSAGCQFFFVHNDYPSWDGDYAPFGMVIDGLDVLDQLGDTPNDGPNGSVAEADKPVIKSITIDSNVEVPGPTKLKR